jgi:hypothetical protein
MGRSGGGGGRSFGGGGGRSSGGRSSGSHGRSRSGGGSSHIGGSWGHSSGSWGHGGGWGHGSGGWGHGGGFHHHHHHHRRPRHYGRGGCSLSAAVILVFLGIIVAIVFQFFPNNGSLTSNSDITKSTIVREPLPKGSAIETGYYTDDIGDWINNSTKLTTGMKNFYQSTGVQPYLYITDNLSGNTNPSDSDADIWMNSTYDELFKDEAHTLLVFYERNGEYSMWYLNGSQAKTVMDSEAMDILMDYVELYYYSDMTEDEMFSKAYDMAATRIMEVTKEPIPWYAILLILIAVIIIIVILINFWKAKKAQKNIEDENTRAILETPLDEINKFTEE